MRAVWKDLFREIWRNKGRFLSIFCIVMLGTAFFAGLRSTGGDMKYSADCFYDDNRMMDIRVVSTLGLSQEDIDDLSRIDGVLQAAGGKTREALLQTGESTLVIRLIAAAQDINDPILAEGRLPQNAGECMIDSQELMSGGLKIGDQIHFESGDEEALSETLTRDTFTIVGSGYLPYYTDLTRGNGSIGDGTIDAFVLLHPDAFDMDIYTEACLRVARAADQLTFDEYYDELVDAVADRIDGLAEVAVVRRYDQVYQEAADAIADAKKEVADGEKELADAAEEIADGHTAIADAEKEIREKEQEIADGWQEVNDGKKELADAQAEIDDGRAQLEDGKKTVADNKTKLAEAKQQYQDGLSQYEAGKKAYEDGKSQYKDGLTQYNEGKSQYDAGLAAYQEGKSKYESGLTQYNEGKSQYEAGLAAYKEGKAQYEAGLAKYNEGKSQYDAGRAALDAQTEAYEAGKAAYEEGLAQYEAQKAQYDASLAQWESQYAAFETGKAQYEEALAQLEAAIAAGAISEEEAAAARAQLEIQAAALAQAENELSQAKTQLDTWKAGLDAGKAQLDAAAAGLAEYETQKAALDAAEKELARNKAELDAAEQTLAQTKAQLDAAGLEIAASEKELAAAKEELDAAKAQLDTSKEELDAGKAELDASKTQIEAAGAQLADSKSQLQTAKEQITSGQAAISQAEKEIAANEEKLSEGQKVVDDSYTQLADAQTQLEDGQARLDDGKKELADKKKELEDAEKEYNEALPDAQKDIAEAREKIADGEKELRDLEVPEWYVLDRSMMESIIGYEDNAGRMDNLSTIFPVIFFLVAALVSLTAMTRMVDEQRMQIGTLKALGYSNRLIAGRYLLYAMLATVGGSLVGIAFGEWFLPRLIIQSYGVMYTGQLYCYTPVNWRQAAEGIAAAAFCTGGATLAACMNQLRSNPATLMRPEAPAAGQRVFLERITPLWKRLSFTRKSTIRNLTRYKKRLIMTIIGVGGCMGLLLVGFGIHDSINEIAKQQYINIFKQDATITFSSSASSEERNDLQSLVDSYEGVTGSEQVSMVSVDLTFDGNIRNAYLYIPQDTGSIGDYLVLRNRSTGQLYDFPEEGAIISEKTAKMLDLTVGDTVTITREGEKNVSVPVTAISENYILHYLFLSPQTYKDLYGKTPDYNSLYLQYDQERLGKETAFGNEMMKQDACAGISFTTDLEANIDDMLGILGNIVIVLIVAAGLLAFVVLYNLNSINIMERRRELATLKVLGFFDTEVAAYVYRENVILTVLGAVLGLVIGAVLHRFVIVTVEVDLMMFGRFISLPSYIYSILITFGFAVVVNLAMYYSLKKVDMIESLKSVE